MAKLTAVLLLVCLFVVGGFCQGRPRQESSQLAKSSGEFGTALYKQLAAGNRDNVIVSPFSVYADLSMLLLGSDGDIKQQLETALAIQPGQDIHQQLRDTISYILTSDHRNELTCEMDNAVYYDPSKITISDSFSEDIRNYKGANPTYWEHLHPERGINQWLNDVTKGAIPKMVEQGEITENKVLKMLSAIVFEASWRDKFSEADTADRDFTTSQGIVRKVATMSQERSFKVKRLEDKQASVLELPYKDDRFKMYVIVPDNPDGLEAIEKQLNGQTLDDILRSMPEPKIHRVQLPKIQMRMRANLKDKLFNMGLEKLFDWDADLSKIEWKDERKGKLHVGKVRHEAKIKVNEIGTKAAAGTDATISRHVSGQGHHPQEFKADRPFLFVVREDSGLNLFMGRFTGPASTGE